MELVGCTSIDHKQVEIPVVVGVEQGADQGVSITVGQAG
jgi:hypothetical protein